MKSIKEEGLNLKRDKYEFGEAVFFGFRVGLGRVEPRQRKLEAKVNCARPTSKKQISQWCGLALDVEKQFYIACDASDRAISGCLFQVIDEFEHPICYISQNLNCHQKAYSTIEKKLHVY